jgi:NAD(P)-dependent dehydrogenase (short-subunit alcohol dehydrogenase family)
MNNLFDLRGKTALITGSTSGMGKAIAEAFGLHGANVIISSHESKALKETVVEFKNKNITAVGILCDMSQTEDIDHLVEASLGHFDKIDILVSCVGIAEPGDSFSINHSSFSKTMGLNLQSAIYLTQRLIPRMQEQKDGSIIYLASIAGIRGNKNLGLYGISKAALIQLARNLAVEFGPDNIRANCISPGLINTPFSNSLIQNQEFIAKRIAQTPLRKVGSIEEIAGVAVLLASKAGGFITGQNIVVDGGTTIGDGN